MPIEKNCTEGSIVKRRRFVLSSLAAGAAAWALAACDDRKADNRSGGSGVVPPLSAREAYEAASRASGFTVGAVMAANTVYVFFDPSCPHCAQLWMAAKPLASKLKMVWLPVGFLRNSSTPQGATILSAPDPAAAMNQNEQSVLDRGGGITANRSVPDDVIAKVEANTALFRKTGADSVPLIVYRNARTGEYGTHAGAVSTDELAALAGLA
jgi:thiol:disulfide interchange protein DsbG